MDYFALKKYCRIHRVDLQTSASRFRIIRQYITHCPAYARC